MQAAIAYIGKVILRSKDGLGAISSFAAEATALIFRPPMRLKIIVQQMVFLGNESVFIIMASGFFIGAVFSVQIGSVFGVFGAESMIGAATGKALSRELSPLLAGFLLAGRGGAAITAELATMKVNEQIDAMEAMAVDPMSYLASPRIVATVLVMPVLVAVFNVLGQLGSLVVSQTLFTVDQGIYMERLIKVVSSKDIWSGLFKSLIFGYIIAIISCWYGMLAKGGAKGVGQATTDSVVTTLLTILFVDLIVTYFQVVF